MEMDNINNVIKRKSNKKLIKEPVGLREMCMYLNKFLEDESRYGNNFKRYKRYYKLASLYPNNIEKVNHVFEGYYKSNMKYGLESSILLDEIISIVLTNEEKDNARRKLEFFKENGLSFIDYYYNNEKYDSNTDLFEQLSLEDLYVLYEDKKRIIRHNNEEENRTVDHLKKRLSRVYGDPGLWYKY